MNFNFIIVARNPNTGKLVVINDGDDEGCPVEFDDEWKAIEVADNTPICKAWGYQIVEIDP